MSEGMDERGLRERMASSAEDRVGRAFSELLESSLLSGALGCAFDAREKAAQAQELAMGALNLPSASDVERLTRRVRSVSQRLEAIEDAIARLDRAMLARLVAIEAQLKAIEAPLADLAGGPSADLASAKPASEEGGRRQAAGKTRASGTTLVPGKTRSGTARESRKSPAPGKARESRKAGS
jgi:hypothetical protein